MDFTVRNFGVVYIGGIEIWITESLRNTWIIMAILIGFAIYVNIKLKSFNEIPKGFQNVIEMIVEAFDGFVASSAGKRLSFLGNWYFMVFIFILTSNLTGLLPRFRPPTADWSVTFAFAMSSFVLIHAMGIKFQKGKYVKETYFSPHFLFFPLNLLGELARPIALSFRLFGNILSGMLLLTLFYSLAPPVLGFIVPAFLHAYFDLVAAVLQTYIFTVLSLSFIGASAATNTE